jgi:hypothetical protein
VRGDERQELLDLHGAARPEEHIANQLFMDVADRVGMLGDEFVEWAGRQLDAQPFFI